MAQETFDPPVQREDIFATRVSEGMIAIDGTLDEEVWKGAKPISGFTQREHIQNDPASVDTEVRVIFDSRFLYVGAVCYDSLFKKN
ncbi:MAG: hypothetical protein AAFN93_26870, partial [Bacteroidota bacterium]